MNIQSLITCPPRFAGYLNFGSLKICNFRDVECVILAPVEIGYFRPFFFEIHVSPVSIPWVEFMPMVCLISKGLEYSAFHGIVVSSRRIVDNKIIVSGIATHIRFVPVQPGNQLVIRCQNADTHLASLAHDVGPHDEVPVEVPVQASRLTIGISRYGQSSHATIGGPDKSADCTQSQVSPTCP